MADLFWAYIWEMQDYLSDVSGIFAFLISQILVTITLDFPVWWPFNI